MRLYIGLPLPESLQQSLKQAWNAIPNNPATQRMIRPSKWHVTLAFLDDVPEDRLDVLRELVEKAMTKPPTGDFLIDRFETFPKKQPMRIVARITPSQSKVWITFVENLRDLASLVAPNVDRKPWNPHISIIKKEKGLALQDWSAEIPPIEWTPREVAIIQSDVGPSSSTYTNLHVFSLDV